MLRCYRVTNPGFYWLNYKAVGTLYRNRIDDFWVEIKCFTTKLTRHWQDTFFISTNWASILFSRIPGIRTQNRSFFRWLRIIAVCVFFMRRLRDISFILPDYLCSLPRKGFSINELGCQRVRTLLIMLPKHAHNRPGHTVIPVLYVSFLRSTGLPIASLIS